MKSSRPAFQGTRPQSQRTKQACSGAGASAKRQSSRRLVSGHQFESMGEVLRSFDRHTDPETIALVAAVADLDDDLARVG